MRFTRRTRRCFQSLRTAALIVPLWWIGGRSFPQLVHTFIEIGDAEWSDAPFLLPLRAVFRRDDETHWRGIPFWHPANVVGLRQGLDKGFRIVLGDLRHFAHRLVTEGGIGKSVFAGHDVITWKWLGRIHVVDLAGQHGGLPA